jgi:hypothetical protein
VALPSFPPALPPRVHGLRTARDNSSGLRQNCEKTKKYHTPAQNNDDGMCHPGVCHEKHPPSSLRMCCMAKLECGLEERQVGVTAFLYFHTDAPMPEQQQ